MSNNYDCISSFPSTDRPPCLNHRPIMETPQTTITDLSDRIDYYIL